jgi:thiol-disulfide isomerase/thioredoxin
MSGGKAKEARRRERSDRNEVPRAGRVRRWLLPAGGLVVVAAVVGGVFAARGNDGSPSFSRGATAGPAVALSGRSPITGARVSLAAYRGEPVVLNVWASWCTGCREEAKDLASFARAHPEAQVVGLDTQDTDGGARAFYREFGWSHPSVRDPSGSTAAELGLQGLPTTIFLDAQGREVTRIIGATNREGFEQGLRAAKNA